MINKEVKLSTKIFEKDINLKLVRDGFGEGLVSAAEKDPRVVVLTADLSESVRVLAFKESFPERFFDAGVAEQAMVTVASGMALYGKVPFVASYAVFSPGRNWEQIRTTIAINNLPVKIVGSHAGINTGPDGVTHQALEDIALMRTLPNMTVVAPCDFNEARKATLEAARMLGPVYLRLGREKEPVITSENTPFKIGRAEVYWHSKNPQATIVACGPMVYHALLAAHELDNKGIETDVVNCHTIKPLDERAIIRAAKITGAIVTAEDHQIAGGLGSAVGEILVKNFPTVMEMVGVKDSFGESGKADELYKKYGLTSKDIVEAVKRAITRKNQ